MALLFNVYIILTDFIILSFLIYGRRCNIYSESILLFNPRIHMTVYICSSGS